MGHVFLYSVPLPLTVKGITLPDNDGNFTILINSDLSPEAQKKALKHELRHVRNNHFSDVTTVESAENEAV